jgi:2-dehydro-3-deoxygalactonokinase
MLSEFFSCDWGTTSFRLRRVDGKSGRALEQRREPAGVRTLFNQAPSNDTAAREHLFAEFLRTQLLLLAGGRHAALDGVAVVVSGMASSSVGWRELPYARAPVGLDGAGIVHELIHLSLDQRAEARVHLISGVRTESDILRGEEIEILGLFSNGAYPDIAEDGLVILPGTHSKHVRLEHRQIVAFQTYLTGELFDALSAHTLLRASVQAPENGPGAPWSDPTAQKAFADGVQSAVEPGLAASLFQTRVRTVLHAVSPAVNRWFLSGLVIGSELVDLVDSDFEGPILLAAAEPVAAAYQGALEKLGLASRLTHVPPEQVALASVQGHQVLLQWLSKAERNPKAS